MIKVTHMVGHGLASDSSAIMRYGRLWLAKSSEYLYYDLQAASCVAPLAVPLVS